MWVMNVGTNNNIIFEIWEGDLKLRSFEADFYGTTKRKHEKCSRYTLEKCEYYTIIRTIINIQTSHILCYINFHLHRTFKKKKKQLIYY